MDLGWFRDLGHLARTKSFNQSARLSNISQPAFSRRIKALENWAGALLVDRSSQPVSLTPEGVQMLEAGSKAVAILQAQRSQILKTNALPDKYTVTFAAQYSIGWGFYPDWLQSLEKSYGPITTRLTTDDLENCVKALEGGKADFLLAFTQAHSCELTQLPATRKIQTFESIIVGVDRLIPVCKATPSGDALFSLDESDARIPFLQYGDKAPISRLLTPALEVQPFFNRLVPVYTNPMVETLRIRIKEGLGIAWLSESVVRADIAAGTLVKIGKHPLEIPLDIRLFQKREHLNHTTRTIWNFLTKHPFVRPATSHGPS